MQIYFPVLLLFATLLVSCSDNNENRTIIKALIIAKEEKKKTDYTERKKICRKLYNEIKQRNSQDKTHDFINFIADSLIPCWYGTKWNFYGMTETPQQGTIACGYFVTTVIRDAGIPIKRIKLAQCASEEMIKSVCESNTIKRFRDSGFEKFTADLSSFGFGLYVIGLDNHTGFIYNDGKKVWFIHSSYITPGCVIKEEAEGSIILKNSKYKVIGKLKI